MLNQKLFYRLCLVLLCSYTALYGCSINETDTPASDTSMTDTQSTESSVPETLPLVEETEPVVLAPEQAAPSAGDPASRYMTENRYGFPADFVYPLTDGTLADLDTPVTVLVQLYDSTTLQLQVPREYIPHIG